jgi:SAM-dependent methyltransferase
VNPTLAAWLEAAEGSDEEFATRLWRLVLRREPEEEALARAVAKLGEGTLSRTTLVRELISEGEFERVAMLDDALAFAHGARLRGGRPRNLHAPPGTDERPIEIPWCLSRYNGEQRVLDLGYAFAEPSYLAGLVSLGASGLVGVDLASAEVPGLRSTVADARELPFEAGSFELAICISTLEHIGRDNEVYGLESRRDDDGAVRSLKELLRVLTGSGRLLLTVPCGEAQDLGWQVQLPPAAWIALFEEAGFVVFEDEIYTLGADGWRSSSPFEPAGVRYGERGPGASAVLCAELRPRRLSERLRLAARDLRHRDEPRRSTRGD